MTREDEHILERALDLADALLIEGDDLARAIAGLRAFKKARESVLELRAPREGDRDTLANYDRLIALLGGAP